MCLPCILKILVASLITGLVLSWLAELSAGGASEGTKAAGSRAWTGSEEKIETEKRRATSSRNLLVLLFLSTVAQMD